MSKLTVVGRLRSQRDHWKRRLDREEKMAAGGRRDFRFWESNRSFVEGLGVAYEEALGIIGDTELEPEAEPDLDVDMACVIENARQGLSLERIASRCGLTEREVAETLIRYVKKQAIR